MFIPRNPFMYPGGSPGVNLAHPAAMNLRLSAIGTPAASAQGIMLALFPGGKITKIGAATTVMGAYGPAMNTTTVIGGNNFSPNVAEIPLGCTLAAIVTPIGSAVTGFLVSGTANGAGPLLAIPSLVLRYTNIANVSSGLPALVVGHTYFVAASYNSKVVYFVITDLGTGQIWRASVASVQTIATVAGGSYTIGGVSTGSNSPNGNLMAVMYSAIALNAMQLNAWAQAPWDFWYPRTPFNIGKLTAGVAPATSAPALMIGV